MLKQIKRIVLVVLCVGLVLCPFVGNLIAVDASSKGDWLYSKMTSAMADFAMAEANYKNSRVFAEDYEGETDGMGHYQTIFNTYTEDIIKENNNTYASLTFNTGRQYASRYAALFYSTAQKIKSNTVYRLTFKYKLSGFTSGITIYDGKNSKLLYKNFVNTDTWIEVEKEFTSDSTQTEMYLFFQFVKNDTDNVIFCVDDIEVVSVSDYEAFKSAESEFNAIKTEYEIIVKEHENNLSAENTAKQNLETSETNLVSAENIFSSALQKTVFYEDFENSEDKMGHYTSANDNYIESRLNNDGNNYTLIKPKTSRTVSSRYATDLSVGTTDKSTFAVSSFTNYNLSFRYKLSGYTDGVYVYRYDGTDEKKLEISFSNSDDWKTVSVNFYTDFSQKACGFYFQFNKDVTDNVEFCVDDIVLIKKNDYSSYNSAKSKYQTAKSDYSKNITAYNELYSLNRTVKIKNASFEDETVSGYSMSDNFSFALNTDNYTDGVQSLKCIGTGKIFQEVWVAPYTYYEWNFDLKFDESLNSDTTKEILKVGAEGISSSELLGGYSVSERNYTGGYGSIACGDNEFNHYTLKFYSGDKSSVNLTFNFTSANNICYIDNLSYTALGDAEFISETNKNTLFKIDFDDSYSSAITSKYGGSNNFKYYSSAYNRYLCIDANGIGSGVAVNFKDKYHITKTTNAILDKNTTYRYTFRGKTNITGSTNNMALRYAFSDNTTHTEYIKLTAEWQIYNIYITTTDCDSLSFISIMPISPCEGQLSYIDDIIFEKAQPEIVSLDCEYTWIENISNRVSNGGFDNPLESSNWGKNPDFELVTDKDTALGGKSYALFNGKIDYSKEITLKPKKFFTFAFSYKTTEKQSDFRVGITVDGKEMPYNADESVSSMLYLDNTGGEWVRKCYEFFTPASGKVELSFSGNANNVAIDEICVFESCVGLKENPNDYTVYTETSIPKLFNIAIVPHNGHGDIVHWKTATEPTALTEGMKTAVCYECGQSVADEIIYCFADVNGDRKVNILDLIRLKKYLVGISDITSNASALAGDFDITSADDLAFLREVLLNF